MQYPDVVAAVNTLIPEMFRTNDPQGVLLKYARENNLTPAVLERMGQAYNQGQTLQTMMGEDRGADARLLDVEDMANKYAAWSPPEELEKAAAVPGTTRIPDLISAVLSGKRAADNAHTLILQLAGDNARLQLAHWRADTRNNEHEALGDLYGTLADLIDRLAEVAMGADSNRDFSKVDVSLDPDTSVTELLTAMKTLAEKILARAKSDNAEDLQNIAAEIIENINRTQYKLQSSKQAGLAEKSRGNWEALLEESRDILEKAACAFSRKLFRDGDVEGEGRDSMILSDAAEADVLRSHGAMAKAAFDWYQAWSVKRWGAAVKRATDQQVDMYKLAGDWSGHQEDAGVMVDCFAALEKCAHPGAVYNTSGYEPDIVVRRKPSTPSSHGDTGKPATPSGTPGVQPPPESSYLTPSTWKPEKEKSREKGDDSADKAMDGASEMLKRITGLLGRPADRVGGQLEHWLDDPRKNKAQSRVDTSAQTAMQQHNLQKLLLTDPVISQADPEEVAGIFETIRRGSDDVAGDINLLRFQLREALQYGGVPPDAYKQLLSIAELRDIHGRNVRDTDKARYGGGSPTGGSSSESKKGRT